MLKQMALRTRLLVGFTMFALLPIFIGMVISSYMNVISTKQKVFEGNLAVAKQIGSETRRLLTGSQGIVEALAWSPTAKAMDAPTLKELIIAAQKANPQFELIFVMDKTGMQIARTSGNLANRGEKAYFKEAVAGKTYFTDTYISAFTQAPTVTISTPIKDNQGAVIGVVAADISLKAIGEIASSVKIGTDGYVDVVDNKGVFLATLDKDRVLKTENVLGIPYIAKVISGQSGTSEEQSTRGDKTLTAYSPVEKFNWGIIIYQPVSEVYSAVIKSIAIVGGVTLILLLIAVGVAFKLSRSITDPVHSLLNVTDKIAHGDLTQNIIIDGAPEVVALGNKFNTMIAALRDIIKRSAKTADTVSTSSEDLAASATQVGKAAEEVAVTIQHVAEGAEKQVSYSQRSANLINEMVKGIYDAGLAAQTVMSAAEQSEQAVTKGAAHINQAIAKMQQIRADVNQTAAVVHDLGDKSRQIGQIVDVITGIAGQTNLLALNAAIEAARAGEQGRGFAVVAEEVRKLAEQSEKAAKEIASIIGAIQNETAAAVHSMDKGISEVAEGVQVVGNSGDAFSEIAQAVKHMRQEVTRIVSMADRLQVNSSEIRTTVDSIADSARLNAASSQQVAAASEEQNASVEEIAAAATNLSQMAADLNDVIRRFKI